MLLSVVLCACDKTMPTDNDGVVRLGAAVTGITEALDSDEFVFTGTSAVGMTAKVLFSPTNGVYKHAPVAPTYMPFHSTITYSSSPTTIFYDPATGHLPLTYPGNEGVYPDVYCVGLYPADDTADDSINKWTFSDDGTKAYFPITGTNDIMFAPQISGNWIVPFENQQYNHLLTWLKFEICASDVKSAQFWGKIQSISVINPHNQIEVTLGTGTVDFKDYDYAGQNNHTKYVYNDVNGVELSITSTYIGQLLCAPDTESGATDPVKYRIRVVTEERPEGVELDVTLKDNNGNPITDYTRTMCKQYIVMLYFNPFAEIDAQCSLVPWNEQNVDLNR